MSLILDALRKADQERQAAQQVPGLNAQHELTKASGNRALLGWLVVLVAALCLVILAWWWVAFVKEAQAPIVTDIVQNSAEKESTEKPAQVKEAATIENSLPALLPEPEKPTEEQGDTVVADAPSPRFDAHYQRTAEKTDTPAAEVEAIEQLYQQPIAEREPAVPVVVKPERPAIGGVRDLPLSVQNRVPTLMYSAHFFESESAPSVILNGQRLQKGSTISGITVEDIDADGVVLRLDNHRFKLNALSSWVNM